MTVDRRLSQGQGAIKKSWRVDNAYESFPTIQTMIDVSEASNTAVAAATTLASGATTTISGGSVTDPSHYRAMRITGSAAGITGNVVITGYDRGGRVVTDTIAAAGASTVDGVIPMMSVASVNFPAYNTVGDTISVGVSEKLGLYRPIESTADVILIERMRTAASEFTVERAGETVNATYGTIVPSGTIIGDDSFKFSFETKIF